MTLDRRKFLKTLGAAGAALALPPFARDAIGEQPPRGSFDFVFFTDTHIQPELDAAHGCDMCFRKIAATKSDLAIDFALMGGDHVYDAFGVNSIRARMVYDLYSRTEQLLGMPVHNTIGNHDVFGVLARSGVAPTDPAYGKKMYQDRMGPTYYSFDHKGYHFVVLDSIQPTDDRLWEARIDDAQLAWLRGDLNRLAPRTPVIAAVHCPIVTAFATYAEVVAAGRKYNTFTVANGPAVLEILGAPNVNLLAVLQGHTHVNENVARDRTQFITGGAVCGNWWHGPRLGTPEGYTVVSLREGALTARYETYGFRSVALNEAWRP
jgi:3',5'-cyclic-AMP phosphodiesterase